MPGLKHLGVALVGNRFGDAAYAEPVLRPLLELRGLRIFEMNIEAWVGNEDMGKERLEGLVEGSGTLRTVLGRVTSGEKRKARELDWGVGAEGKKKKKRVRVKK